MRIYWTGPIPVSVTDRGSLAISFLGQYLRAVLSSVSWQLNDEPFPVLLLFSVTA